ncbi:subtilase family protein [Natranaerovirga hydrolytica]|uniref:Subtilase family protein n=1 Tax=Natranaerovirga hydrolytica TaxID=680378 RepID=A0A4R1MZ70_9FIRM|nr:S8 family peptidase [Natranaerovirga hydrolytica]TCK98465.1 subtilase family protein [Natranaerovirga hydrolytica]
MEDRTLSLEEVILSEEYADIIVPYLGDINFFLEQFDTNYYQIIDNVYAILHIPLEQYFEILLTFAIIDLNAIITLFGPSSIEAIDSAGILSMHNHPYLPLRGNDVLIGFVDSGIDYLHPAFIYEDATTKILSIWDQTITEGQAPEGFNYGTEYTSEDINKAIQSDNPLESVPSVDDTGHGTFLAGIAAGRYIREEDFAGAAPDAEIVMVKLKRAKQYVADRALIQENAVVYQNTDIIQGLEYLVNKATAENKPLVICVALSTNFAAHDGSFVLEEILAKIADNIGIAVVIAAGNEANLGHHYEGNFPEGAIYQDVEINVAENEKGLLAQLWVTSPDIYSVGVLSPTGDFLSRFAPRLGQRGLHQFILEPTFIYIEYHLIEERSGDQLIFLRIADPTPGIWTIRVYGDVVVSRRYNIWIDREGWINPRTQFLNPSSNTTVVIPGTHRVPITVGAYDYLTDTLFIGSGRGPTRDLRIKPDLVAPGVNVLGPVPNNQFVTQTGTSIAAAYTAGAAALLLEWGIVLGNDLNASTKTIKKTLIRGAIRNPNIEYPNNEWGYGILNVVNSFEVLRDRFL